MLFKQGHQQIASWFQLQSTHFAKFVNGTQQSNGNPLREEGRSKIGSALQSSKSLNYGFGRAHPSDPQTSPDELTQRADTQDHSVWAIDRDRWRGRPSENDLRYGSIVD